MRAMSKRASCGDTLFHRNGKRCVEHLLASCNSVLEVCKTSGVYSLTVQGDSGMPTLVTGNPIHTGNTARVIALDAAIEAVQDWRCWTEIGPAIIERVNVNVIDVACCYIRQQPPMQAHAVLSSVNPTVASHVQVSRSGANIGTPQRGKIVRSFQITRIDDRLDCQPTWGRKDNRRDVAANFVFVLHRVASLCSEGVTVRRRASGEDGTGARVALGRLVSRFGN